MKTREELLVEIEGVLGMVRQGLAMHGGNVELVDVDPASGRVSVRMQGACVGCPMSELTLKAGIEDALVSMVEGVTEVVNIEEPVAEEACCTSGALAKE
ncbi:MAG: hypothetical protein QG668_93 [Patescibacteria group bacterium]|nr:hypothetical protein [Patescibacteria group bacterium]